jgi:hypothetical protein
MTRRVELRHPFGGRDVAVRQGSGSGTLSFLLADHLGSAVEVLNAAGGTVSEQTYWPYGRARSGVIATACWTGSLRGSSVRSTMRCSCMTTRRGTTAH